MRFVIYFVKEMSKNSKKPNRAYSYTNLETKASISLRDGALEGTT
jgi:hypothetical protein